MPTQSYRKFGQFHGGLISINVLMSKYSKLKNTIILYYSIVLLYCIIVLFYCIVLLCCIIVLYCCVVLLYCIIVLYYFQLVSRWYILDVTWYKEWVSVEIHVLTLSNSLIEKRVSTLSNLKVTEIRIKHFYSIFMLFAIKAPCPC